MMSGQFHVPAALLPVRILCEARWALVRSRRNGGKTVSALASRLVLITLSWLDLTRTCIYGKINFFFHVT